MNAPPGAGAARLARTESRVRLGVEITVVLCIKLLLLFLLWDAWFSNPVSKRLTEGSVAAALFGPAMSSPSRKERHDGSGH